MTHRRYDPVVMTTTKKNKPQKVSLFGSIRNLFTIGSDTTEITSKTTSYWYTNDPYTGESLSDWAIKNAGKFQAKPKTEENKEQSTGSVRPENTIQIQQEPQKATLFGFIRNCFAAAFDIANGTAKTASAFAKQADEYYERMNSPEHYEAACKQVELDSIKRLKKINAELENMDVQGILQRHLEYRAMMDEFDQ